MIEKIDVTIATKNNEKTIVKCIECIKKYVPYNKIILLDDSVDNTPKIAKQMGAMVYHVPALLGEKRYLQAKLSSTAWIASIDSDVFVYPNWWELINNEIKDGVGAINGFLESDFKNVFPSYEKLTKFCSSRRLKKTGKGSAIGNTLINRRLLLYLKNDLMGTHAGEDTIIGQRIQDLGYKWISVKTPIGFHFHNDAIKHHYMAYYRDGKSIVINKGKLMGLRSIFTSIINHSINWTMFSFYSKKFDFQLYRFLLSLYLEMVKGVVNGIKEL